MYTPDRKLGIAPVATSTEEALAKRKLKSKRTLTDEVESVHLALLEDEQYQARRSAYKKEGTVEGAFKFDDAKALEIVRTKAVDMGVVAVANAKLADLERPWRTVLRRFNEGRKDLLRLNPNGWSPPIPETGIDVDDIGDDEADGEE